jgi:fimbrial chaperone protein
MQTSPLDRVARLPILAALGLALGAFSGSAHAGAIMVSPVNVVLAPGQTAATLTIGNDGDREVSFQVRSFGWQEDRAGDTQLTPTTELLVSPPLGTIAPGATQVVRLVLAHPPRDRELSYRILFDELTPPTQAGLVHISLRLSIPVFAEPAGIAAPHVQWRFAGEGAQMWLVAHNDGKRHQTVRDIALQTADGQALGLKPDTPPYVLAGGEHRWSIQAGSRLPAPGTPLRLTANGDGGAIAEQVRLNVSP